MIENTPATAAAPKKTASKTGRAKQPVRRAAAARKPVEHLREITVSEISGLYAIKSGTKDVLFAATGLGLLKSGDAGERWIAVDLSSATAVTGLFAAPNPAAGSSPALTPGSSSRKILATTGHPSPSPFLLPT